MTLPNRNIEMMKQVTISLLLCLVLSAGKSEANARKQDLTLTPGAIGEDVVDAVVEKMEHYLTLSNDNNLMKRLAWVESSFGINVTSSELTAHGIWKVTVDMHIAILNTTSTYTALLLDEIQRKLNIKSFPEKKDYSIPLHSALACRLFIELTTYSHLPDDLSSQALWWLNNYKPGNDRDHFKSKVEELEKNGRSCQAGSSKMDIWFLVDGSYRIQESYYHLLLSFVLKLAKKYPISRSDVQVGFSVYSYRHEMHHQFRNSDGFSSLETFVNLSTQISEHRNFKKAFQKVLYDGYSGRLGARFVEFDVQRMIIFVTNGKSSENFVDILSEVHATGTKVFAIGIGSAVDTEEIRTIASDPDSLYSIFFDDFVDLLSDVNLNKLYEQMVGTEDDASQDKIDLWFLLDGSSDMTAMQFHIMTNFTSAIAEKLIISPAHVQVGLSAFGEDHKIYYSFIQMQNITFFQNASLFANKPIATKRTGVALEDIRKQGFSPAYGARTMNDVKKVIMLVTTGGDEGFYAEAKAIHANGISVFVVGVGAKSDISSANIIASYPPSQYSYLVATFNKLQNPTELIDHLYQDICEMPFPFITGSSTSLGLIKSDISLTQGNKHYLVANLRRNHTITIKMSDTSGSGRVYVSTQIRNPSEAFHEFKFVLNQTHSSELVLSEKVFESFGGDYLPVYITVISDSQSKFDVNFKARVLDLNAPVQQTSLIKPVPVSKTSTPKIMGWLIALLVMGCLAVAIVGYVLQQHRKAPALNDEESSITTESSFGGNTEKVLMELQVLSRRAKEPQATVTSFNTLCKKIVEAERLEASHRQLEEFYKVLHDVKDQHIEILEKLKVYTCDAKKETADVVVLEKLQSQLYVAESLLLAPSKLVKANSALEALKQCLQPQQTDSDRDKEILQSLKEIVAEAKSDAATTFSLLKLQHSIKQAEDSNVSPLNLRRAYQALDDLNQRLYTVLDDLNDLTYQAQNFVLTSTCLFKLENQIKLAQNVAIAEDEVNISRDEWRKLQKRINMLDELRDATEKAKKAEISAELINDLLCRVEAAQQEGIPPILTKKSTDLLELLEKRLEIADEMAETEQEGNNPAISEFVTNMRATLNSTSELSLPSDHLNNLQELRKQADELKVPASHLEELDGAIQLTLERRKILGRLNECVKEAWNAEDLEEAADKLTERLSLAEDHNIPATVLSHAHETLKKMRFRIKAMDELQLLTEEAMQCNVDEECLERLREQLELLASQGVPHNELHEYHLLLDEARERRREMNATDEADVVCHEAIPVLDKYAELTNELLAATRVENVEKDRNSAISDPDAATGQDSTVNSPEDDNHENDGTVVDSGMGCPYEVVEDVVKQEQSETAYECVEVSNAEQINEQEADER